MHGRIYIFLALVFVSIQSGIAQSETHFRVGLNEPVSSLFPPEGYGLSDLRVLFQISEGLVRYSDDGKQVEPALAKSWEYDEEQHTLTFHLRTEARFHDDPCFPDGRGRQVKASDFERTFRFLCTESDRNEVSWLLTEHIEGAQEFYEASVFGDQLPPNISGIKAPNDSTLVLTLVRPGYDFLLRLAMPAASVWPPEALEKYGRKIKWHPVGTGPFRFDSQKKDEVRLVRNPHYWGRDERGEQLPYLDRVEFQYWEVPTDQVAALRSGGLDLVIPDHLLIPHFITDGELSTAWQGFESKHCTYLNTGFYGFLTSGDELQDPKIRRALNLAVDREAVINDVLNGAADPATKGIVPDAVAGYERPPSDLSYSTQITEAKQLLSEAGFVNGVDFPELRLSYNRKPDGINRRVAEHISSQLNQHLGIKVTPTPLSFEDHLDLVETGNVPLWRDGWFSDFPSALNYLNLFYGPEIPENPALPSEVNVTRYANAQFDSIFDLAANSWDLEQHHRYCYQAEEILLRDAPVLLLWYNYSYVIFSDDWQGIQPNVHNTCFLRNVRKRQK